MNLHNDPLDILEREVWGKRERWGNIKLTDAVCEAVRAGKVRPLVELIDQLVDGVNQQRETILTQEKEIKRLKAELKKPPAKRKDLDDEKMYQLYQKHKSFSKVAEQMNCDKKTVQNHLRAAGYI